MYKILLILILFFLFPHNVQAAETDQFITLVNPVRISHYSDNPILSLKKQYQPILQRQLPASWLFTYDALTFPEMSDAIKSMDNNQDIGLFLEVTEKYASASGVIYNKTDSWHRSNSIFLSGYNQSDRIKLIDNLFEEFKKQFNYYPTSVGAWWIDSFSLNYMQKKYGITANLVVADQVGTDGYTIWGQYWSLPYYPSKNHAAIPAQNSENKLDIVNLQWAPRDPLNGYSTPSNLRSSLYSTQDYYTIGLSDDYLENLISLYSSKNENNFGQITLGLEGDFGANSYSEGSQYEKYIQTAKKFSDTGNFTVSNMKQFSQWYRNRFPEKSPAYIIESKNLLEKNSSEAIWYQNPQYRLGGVFNPSEKKFKIVDLRIYQQNFREPFYLNKNDQLDLYINLPSVIDTIIDPQNYLEIDSIQEFSTKKEGENYIILFDNQRSLELSPDKIILKNINKKLPEFITKSSLVSTDNSENNMIIEPVNNFPVPTAGYTFKDLSIEATYFLSTKKAKIIILVALVLTIFSIFMLIKVNKTTKIAIVIFFILVFLSIAFLYFNNLKNYQVSQSEIDALLKLKTYPPGKVLILNKDCLPCGGQTSDVPAAFANKRDYVKKFSEHNLIYDDKLIEVNSNNLITPTKLTKEETKQYLKKLDVDYIYLVKHQDYIEKLPYSPGDLGVEQIYFNADAEVWRVKQ